MRRKYYLCLGEIFDKLPSVFLVCAAIYFPAYSKAAATGEPLGIDEIMEAASAVSAAVRLTSRSSIFSPAVEPPWGA